MWQFIMVEDEEDDTLGFKYGILQTFSETIISAEQIAAQYKRDNSLASIEAIDARFSDVTVADEGSVLRYSRPGFFTLSICEEAFSSRAERLCANRLLEEYAQEQRTMHIALVDHNFLDRPSVVVHGVSYASNTHGEALIHQHMDRSSAPRQFFFASKLISKTSGGEALKSLENNYGKKVLKLYKPILNDQRSFDEDYDFAIAGWKRTLRHLAKDYAQYLPEATRQILRAYRPGQPLPRFHTSDGIEWQLPAFLAGWIPPDHRALSESEMANIIQYELFTADLSIAFSEAFAIRAVKDLTHQPAGTYHPVAEVPTGVRDQLTRLRQTLGQTYDDLAAQEWVHWPRIQQSLEIFLSISDAWQRMPGGQEEQSLRLDLEDRLIALRKAAFQFTAEVDQGELEGQILSGSELVLDPLVVPQKFNSPAIKISTRGLVALAREAGLQLRPFSLPRFWPRSRVEYYLPLVDLFQDSFRHLFERIVRYARVDDVSVAFLSEWAKAPHSSYRDYVVGLCDHYLLLGNRGKAFPAQAFDRPYDPPSASRAFRGFHLFGEY